MLADRAWVGAGWRVNKVVALGRGYVLHDDHEHVTDDTNAGMRAGARGGDLVQPGGDERLHCTLSRTILVVGAILADRFTATVQFGNELEAEIFQLLRSIGQRWIGCGIRQYNFGW